MKITAAELIVRLSLLPHPEGGYYRETYRSKEACPNVEGKERSVCTSIFYLLEGNDKSHFHRIKSDEHWFFHYGEPIEILSIKNGSLSTITLGNNVVQNESPQATIPAGAWFAARLKKGIGFGLASCVVSPGFDFSDFELAKRGTLCEEFPALKNTIVDFTRD